ncbi:Mediator of RNA polymerase II transcription subunit 6 [Gnomoniopsis smithogilvyi]|uniref:Mediator of RNA polymerase II transcription subunit 6 n=1 Tax=Gnomoniopsis smithogilvyi TaxID=1191159 RepID=A0A9W8YRJ5_9PEZI|nr:Mediator of RNA polymerase II transcription subunit 6 [Gnomoniopsis smithogilvyi]
MVSIAKESALDEIVWCDPKFIHDHGPLHNNTVLMYFADSPWCDPTSNNRVIMAQSFFNANLANIVATRETFEERLRSMSGLEYIVSEAPEETGPGMGTGVWVIKKQTRKKRNGQEDELTVHALYYIIGQNIYPAPSLMDTMSSKMASISNAIGSLFEAANSIQKWTPARGHAYMNPAAAPRAGTLEPKGTTPMPDGDGTSSGQNRTGNKAATQMELDTKFAEESFAIHEAFGGEYMDEIPITGKPGDFHFASTGRNDKLAVPQPQAPPVRPPVLAPLNTVQAAEVASAKDAKKTKSPKPGSAMRSKDRRKSKAGTATGTPTGTPKPT